MVHTCVVKGCKNRSNLPSCLRLSWHRVPATPQLLKKAELSSLPNRHSRICSECFKKVRPMSRKPPVIRNSITTIHKPTREELRQAVAHDHTYCQRSSNHPLHASYLRPTPQNAQVAIVQCEDGVELPEVVTKLPALAFRIEQIVDDNQAICFIHPFLPILTSRLASIFSVMQ